MAPKLRALLGLWVSVNFLPNSQLKDGPTMYFFIHLFGNHWVTFDIHRFVLNEKCFSRDGKIFCREDFYRWTESTLPSLSWSSSSSSLLLRYENSTLILYKELSSPIFQSCESVSESGIGNTCPDLHFVQYTKAKMPSPDPVLSITNCYRLIVSYTEPLHSFIIS